MPKDDIVYKVNLETRMQPVNKNQVKRPLLDLRLCFTYDIPKKLFYLFSYADLILELLQKRKFYCPGYTHIYISIGQTKKNAIEGAIEIEKWFRYGISVLPLKKLLSATDKNKEHLILKAIEEGLLDLAKRDNLNKKAIKDAIAFAKEGGLFQEITMSSGENSKYQFLITSLPIKGKSNVDVYFSLIDKAERKQYKWRFGRLDSLLAAWWFLNVKVTNKEIRTKPKSNTELVLKGKKNRLKLSVEKIKKGGDRITISKTKVPVPAWLARLDKL